MLGTEAVSRDLADIHESAIGLRQGRHRETTRNLEIAFDDRCMGTAKNPG